MGEVIREHSSPGSSLPLLAAPMRVSVQENCEKAA